MLNPVYAHKVELLLRLLPYVMDEGVFAVHGGTAINLFIKNMPRYSVDIDLTYIPLDNRENSIKDINAHLLSMATKAKHSFPGLHIMPNLNTCKLLCEYHGYQIKVEVNQTKRGIIGGDTLTLPLCDKAQEVFGQYCEATIVPKTLLYGGKIAAAISRQHPRDLFDVRYMDIPMSDVREGFMFCLLSSDRPLYESFAPTLIDQRAAMVNQFEGMTDIPFTYDEFVTVREQLIRNVNHLFTDNDKDFLLTFESGEPDWRICDLGDLSVYPSIQWKLINLTKLRKQNIDKLKLGVERLKNCFQQS